MAQKSLLQMLEEVARKVEALEREKKEAIAAVQALQREVAEMVSLITLASEKMDEILKVGVNDEKSQPQAINPPVAPKDLERLGEFSPDQQKEVKRGFPRASSSN
jgi:hypothetical protein